MLSDSIVINNFRLNFNYIKTDIVIIKFCLTIDIAMTDKSYIYINCILTT